MSGFNVISGDEGIMNVDNCSFDGTDRGGKMTTNGQLWIGSTTSNRANNGGHVRLGTVTSPDNSLIIGYTAPNITATVNRSVVTDLHAAQLIVSSGGSANGANFTTIASALAAAVSGQTIFIQPGTYTENLTLKAGVNLAAFDSDGFVPNGFTPAVTIVGNLTASYNGNVNICGIQLQTNNAACLTISGSNTSNLDLINCSINGVNATAISANAANFSVKFRQCIGFTSSNNLLFSITSIAAIGFYNCDLSAGTAANTIASGSVNIYNTICGAFSITTSSSGNFNAYNSLFQNTNQTIFTTAGTGSGIINNSQLSSGTASAISVGTGTTVQIASCPITSSNTNVITGAGTLNYGDLTFPGSSSTINTTTRNFIIQSPRMESWTPTVVGSTSAGTATYTIQQGLYTRIGPLVYVEINVQWNTGTGTGNLMIGGLPINITNASNVRSVGSMTIGNGMTPPANTVTVWIVAAGDANQTQLFCQAGNTSGNGVNYPYSATGGVNATIMYVSA